MTDQDFHGISAASAVDALAIAAVNGRLEVMKQLLADGVDVNGIASSSRDTALCAAAGLAGAEIAPLEIETDFADFEEFWRPFTLGAGPAPGYAASLSEEARAQLAADLHDELGDGPMALTARAWAVRYRRLE